MREMDEQIEGDAYAQLLAEAMRDYDNSKKAPWETVEPQSELYDLEDMGYYLELLTRGASRAVSYKDKYSERTNANGLREVYKEDPHELTNFSLIVIPQGSQGYMVLGVRTALNYALSEHPYKQTLHKEFGIVPAGTHKTLEDPAQGILFSGKLSYEDGVERRRGSRPMTFTYAPQLIPPGVDSQAYQARQMQLAEYYLTGNPSHVGTLLGEAVRR